MPSRSDTPPPTAPRRGRGAPPEQDVAAPRATSLDLAAAGDPVGALAAAVAAAQAQAAALPSGLAASVAAVQEAIAAAQGNGQEAIAAVQEAARVAADQDLAALIKTAAKSVNDRYIELSGKRFRAIAESYGAVRKGEEYPGFWSDPFCSGDFSRPVLRRAGPRFLCAFIFYTLGVYTNSVSQAWLQQNISGHYEDKWPLKGQKTLWDVTFHYLPPVDSTQPADVFAVSAPILLVFRFVVLPGPLSLRWTILRRWLMVWGAIWFVRATTIIVTPLPNPDESCKPIISYPDNIFLEGFAIPFMGDLTCQDVMFSGHTVALTLAMLFLFRYINWAPCTLHGASRAWLSLNTLITFLGSIYLLCGYYCIAGSRFHYTLDVLVGALITQVMFTSYHNRIELAWLRKVHGGNGPFDPALQWLEGYSKDLPLKAGGGWASSELMWLARH